MKTSPLKAAAVLAAVWCVQATAAGPRPLNRFECLNEMLVINDRGSFQSHRQGFEAPFLVGNKYLVFAEIKGDKVTGFFVYDRDHAWYYDGVEVDGVKQAISALKPDTTSGILELTAQPNGLETVSIRYLPGYNPRGTDKHGPVVLGSSVLPVVGAFVSRPRQVQITYFDPVGSSTGELKQWLSSHATNRRTPAGVSEFGEVAHTIVKMVTLHPKAESKAWDPVENELKIRRDWVQNHNLDEETFKKVSKVIGSCAP